jgi:hypothetical protein
MQSTRGNQSAAVIPKKRSRHYSYNESVDEPARLLEEEAVEVEEELPAEDTDSIESIEPDDASAPPAFTE